MLAAESTSNGRCMGEMWKGHRVGRLVSGSSLIVIRLGNWFYRRDAMLARVSSVYFNVSIYDAHVVMHNRAEYAVVCCVTFAESEPYCHSRMSGCLFVCLSPSVIPRPTAYHD